MKFPQFTIRHWMVAVALFSVVLALPGVALVTGEVVLLLALPALVLAQFPLRVRLAVEIPTLLGLIVFALDLRESDFYAGKSDRAAEYARHSLEWAAVSKDSSARAILDREAAWFLRRSVSLRVRGVWGGFLYGRTYPHPRGREENGRLLDELWEIRFHEDAARQAHERSFPGSFGP